MATFIEAVNWMKKGNKAKCGKFTYHLDGNYFYRGDNCNADFDLSDFEDEWELIPFIEAKEENKLQYLIDKHESSIDIGAMFGYSLNKLSKEDLKACAIEGFSLYHNLLREEK